MWVGIVMDEEITFHIFIFLSQWGAKLFFALVALPFESTVIIH